MALFKKCGDHYDIDYLVLMAQGYQESELDQNARSAAGAIGIMRVMPATGRDMQVGDITLLEPNIHAGVKFLRAMMNEYYANEPMDQLNRGLFTFAAYNADPGRIAGVRRLAAQRGLDPNVWFNNVELMAAEKIGRETGDLRLRHLQVLPGLSDAGRGARRARARQAGGARGQVVRSALA